MSIINSKEISINKQNTIFLIKNYGVKPTFIVLLFLLTINYTISDLPIFSDCTNFAAGVLGRCIKCQEGHILDSTSTACLPCNEENFQESLCSCSDGYYINEDKIGFKRVCTRCKSGFFLYSGACSPCSNISNCYSCADYGCTTCKSGFFLSSGVCLPSSNISNCSFFTNGGCAKCKSGFYEGCSPPGLHWSKTFHCINDEKCTSCICSPCSDISNCSSCTNDTKCTTCKSGFYLKSGGCSPCSDISNCSSCTNDGKCKECKSGFYLKSGACSPCSDISNCSSCTNDGKCKECKSGFYLKSGACSPCSDISNCSSCTNDGKCKECKSGFYLKSGACSPCSDISNCSSCTNDRKCKKCKSGFYLESGTCIVISDEDKNIEKIYENVIKTLEIFEGNKLKINVPIDSSGNVLGKSGPTIGIGIDLGQRSKSDIQKLNIPQEVKDKLSPYTSKIGKEALEFIRKNPLTLKTQEVWLLNKAVIIPFIKNLVKQYDSASKVKFSKLPIEAQQVIVSVSHQFGNLAKVAPNFWSYITNSDWTKAGLELINWNGKGKPDPYRKRRLSEKELLDKIVKT